MNVTELRLSLSWTVLLPFLLISGMMEISDDAGPIGMTPTRLDSSEPLFVPLTVSRARIEGDGRHSVTITTPPVNPTPSDPFAPLPQPPSSVFANCIVREDRDTQSDGTIDSSVVTYFNEFSNWIVREVDERNDGNIDSAHFAFYGDENNLVRAAHDYDNNGVIDDVLLYFYDVDQQKVKEIYDKGANEIPDRITSFEYDGDGRVVAEIIDRNADTIADYTFENMYLPMGLRYERVGRQGGDNALDFRVLYTWDDSRRLTQKDYFSGPSLTKSATLSYLYDDQGRLVREVLEDDYWTSYTYEQHGWISREEHFHADEKEDSMSYSYDSQGRLSTRAFLSVAYPPYSIHNINFCP